MKNEFLYPVLSILVVALVTCALRAFPFLLFGKRKLPDKIQYLEKVLPFSIMTILVLYCLRNIDFAVIPFGFSEISAAALVIVLQSIKKNMYLSIIAGTAYYMLMLRIF